MSDRSRNEKDPLSDLLDFLQIDSKLSGQLVAGGEWSRCFENLDAIKFCAVIEGNGWYFIDGMTEPNQVAAGDVLITNGTRILSLASDLNLMCDVNHPPMNQDKYGVYKIGEGCNFAMLAGIVNVDEDRRALLMNALPPLIHVKGTAEEAKPISWLLQQLVIEMRSHKLGCSTVVSSLAQLLFAQTMRAYLVNASEGDEGWLKGFGDPKLMTVLSCIHRAPSRNWKLEELAREAGMSRTSLAVRFREVMGLPPLAYLTQWRMYLAKRELRFGASISEAAITIGYSSESAFSKTFKRIMSISPSQYRKLMYENK